jgi:hypothetical protein
MEALRYIALEGKHSLPDEPIGLYSEIDCDGWEKRKVEEFRAGRLTYANATTAAGSTRLGKEAIPEIAEIAKDSQFSPRKIMRAKFEEIWQKAIRT